MADDRISGLDIFRLIAASCVLLTWMGVVIYSSITNHDIPFGVHAVSAIASGYLFASPIGRAFRRTMENGEDRPR